jgi:hypothetical protein
MNHKQLELVHDYAHDFRDIEQSEEELKVMLLNFAIEFEKIKDN